MPLPAKKERAMASDSKESVMIAARNDIPHGSARKERKEESRKGKETSTKDKVKDGVVEKASGETTEEPQGDRKWEQPEEEKLAGSIQSLVQERVNILRKGPATRRDTRR